jgi:hypothetical protein
MRNWIFQSPKAISGRASGVDNVDFGLTRETEWETTELRVLWAEPMASQYPHGHAYDLFVSYSTRDLDWVRVFHAVRDLPALALKIPQTV